MVSAHAERQLRARRNRGCGGAHRVGAFPLVPMVHLKSLRESVLGAHPIEDRAERYHTAGVQNGYITVPATFTPAPRTGAELPAG